MKKNYLFLLTAILVWTSCAQETPRQEEFVHELTTTEFVHELTTTTKPWSSTDFNTTDSTFMFAIISDLNGGEREGVFARAVEQINLFQPEFVLSVGDLIDGGTDDREQLQKEFDSFDERASKLNAPFFHVGGNHDLTHPVMREFWEERYGARYYHFIYKNVLFLMLDSEDYEYDRMMEIYEARKKVIDTLDSNPEADVSGFDYYTVMPERRYGEIGQKQSDYFESVIKANPDVRWTFILMHKPVWQREDDKGLSGIETALEGRNYTVINGHFHIYSHRLKNDMDYLILGTTGGTQFADEPGSVDHFTLVTLSDGEPSLVNVKMDGIFEKTGLK